MKKPKHTSFILGLIGLSLWIIYLFEKEMSNYGIYSLVDYNVHEILSLVPLMSILVTMIWLLMLIKESLKHKNNKPYIALFILSIALFFQGNYLLSQYNQVSRSTVARVINIDSQKEEISISSDLGEAILDCPMTIFTLLEADKEYLISYLHEKENPNKGKVNLVQRIGN